jgi:hypothetical protein
MAIPGSIAGVIFYEMLVAKIIMIQTRNYISNKRADQQKQRRAARESPKENK